MRTIFLNFIAILIAFQTSSTATNYCKPELCTSGSHIVCGNSGKFLSNCSDDAIMIDITPELQDIIVAAHNEKRNFIAGGGDINHKPACRMPTMQWDDELAYMASFNVRQCEMKHDKCHNTDAFLYSGQNLYRSSYNGEVDNKAEFTTAISQWYNEVNKSKMNYANKFLFKYLPLGIGHFLVMMHEKNTHVGCAASHYSLPDVGRKSYLIACNYATNNMINFPIYTGCSKGGTGCKTGAHSIYPNLCSVSEKIDVNNWY